MSPNEIIARLESRLAELKNSLNNSENPDGIIAAAIAELGGHPNAGVKVVDLNYRPAHRSSEFCYSVGSTLTADDWDGVAKCKRGLHYSEYLDDAVMYSGARSRDWRAVIVVATGDRVVIDSSKSKAQTVYVDREIDRAGWDSDNKTLDTIRQIEKAISAYHQAKREYRNTLKAIRSNG